MGKKNPAELKNKALITGASKGIGYAIARELAKISFELYLVSLPGQNLENLALDLSRKFNDRINFMEASLDQKENCQNIFDDITGRQIPVNMLVNKAGIGFADIFEDYREAKKT
jgi:short-subunit dehydrogenase